MRRERLPTRASSTTRDWLLTATEKPWETGISSGTPDGDRGDQAVRFLIRPARDHPMPVAVAAGVDQVTIRVQSGLEPFWIVVSISHAPEQGARVWTASLHKRRMTRPWGLS